jgi:hypothetical protein
LVILQFREFRPLCLGMVATLFVGAIGRSAALAEGPANPSTGLGSGGGLGAGEAGGKLLYNRDIRPILAEYCFACHGPDSAARKADLRLDQREGAVEGGAMVPGEPEGSELIARILLPASDEKSMPPAAAHKVMKEGEKELLRRWISEGAEYQSHWSLITPVRPEFPSVSDAGWVRNPIDNFIAAGLERVGLTPAAEADRRTLARRAALDLIGLPPSVEQVEAFVADPSPEAYERYVDALLESKRYGEHRARYWLDYARYADTHGIHFDNYREIWAYRDWVIDAFNRNLSFDQFTIEQLAGDLLPQPTLDQRIATGFNRCNITTNEGGVIAEEYKVLYARDRTETTSLVWMGLTVGCAVCHDHKFDPISTRDFYSLSAFFNNTTQAVMDGNIKDTPPVIAVPRLEDRARFEALPAEIAEAQRALDQIRESERKRFDGSVTTLGGDAIADTITEDALLLHAPLAEGAGPASTLRMGGKFRSRYADQLRWSAPAHVAPAALELAADSVLTVGTVAEGWEQTDSFSYGAWIFLPGDNLGGAVLAKMDEGNQFRGFDLWLEGNRVGAHLIHAWPDNALKVVTANPLPANRWHHVMITYDGSRSEAGLKIYVNGEQETRRNVQGAKLDGSIRTEVPFRIGARSQAQTPGGVRVNDVRLYSRNLAPEEVRTMTTATRIGYLAARGTKSRTAEEKEEFFAWWLRTDSPGYATAERRLASLRDEESAIKAAGTIAHVMAEQSQPAEAFILARGEYDKRGERVTPEVPAVLPRIPEGVTRDRLGLARWLLAAEHPLTARVTVNRFWQEVFGTGLVETSDDFGVTGRLPSHPELLDWLAIEFRESGWDVKRLLKLMVTSAAYRQAAKAEPNKLAIDPDNRLLSRGPRFRLDAEMIRDQALEVSGLLSAKIGGPSVKPYQPEGVWEAVAMRGSNTRDYRQDTGESLYRRSLYTFWKRSAPPAMLDIFNAPSRETCTIRRDRTNTPLQALATLNDPQGIEAARHLASLVMRGQADPVARIEMMARKVLSRPLVAAELTIVSESLETLLTHYAGDPVASKALIEIGESPTPEDLPASELAAYTMLANELLNLDEALNK